MPPCSSYVSPKCEKGAPSAIEGRCLRARAPISAGEVVAVKGGRIVDRETLRAHAQVVGNSELQITDELYLAALSEDEYEAVMLYLNHSCEPNCGVAGSAVFVALREIAPGEELTIDYAMIDDHDGVMECRCGAPSCRRLVRGRDWRRPELQRRYGHRFSWYLRVKAGLGT